MKVSKVDWVELIKSAPSSCSRNEKSISEYRKLLKDNPLDELDLVYMSRVLGSATINNGHYDSFPDRGGVDIGRILLAHVLNTEEANRE